MIDGGATVEVFGCSGGMAEGFRRAGITFDWSFDYDADACASYEKNLGHRPVRMDARDLLRMLNGGWSFGPVALFVADPPCTPWSRAGKRKGLADERDMLPETIELIERLKPRAYLIGNVPGLEDAGSWKELQRLLAPLARLGYCVLDFATLDAADYGVPQHRVRPFWYGHLAGPCLRWPARTHGDPKELQTATIPGVDPLRPWVSCREALSHLAPKDLGRPVRLRWKDGFDGPDHRPSRSDEPAKTLTKNTHSDGSLLVHPRHPPSVVDAPGRTVLGSNGGGAKGTVLLARTPAEGHAPHENGKPARTLRAASRGNEALVLGEQQFDPKHPPSEPDVPSRTITASASQNGGGAMAWPWDRPSTTILADPRIPPPGHHGGSFLSHPSMSKKFKHERPRPPQAHRVGKPDESGATVTAKAARVGSGEATTLEWPWERPSTTVCAGIDKIAAAGEHEGHKGPNAIVLSEVAAAVLQGFPEGWLFSGKTKGARWAQIGMAMPPGLAEPVARSIVEQLKATEER